MLAHGSSGVWHAEPLLSFVPDAQRIQIRREQGWSLALSGSTPAAAQLLNHICQVRSPHVKVHVVGGPQHVERELRAGQVAREDGVHRVGQLDARRWNQWR